MIQQIHRLQAINEAIWLRDHAHEVSRNLLIKRLQELSEYGLFSNRQITNIIGHRYSHVTVCRFSMKQDLTGGAFNPKTLEDLRDVLFMKHNKNVDYALVKKIIDAGTSQGMVSRLTGINQSTISRKISNVKTEKHFSS